MYSKGAFLHELSAGCHAPKLISKRFSVELLTVKQHEDFFRFRCASHLMLYDENCPVDRTWHCLISTCIIRRTGGFSFGLHANQSSTETPPLQRAFCWYFVFFSFGKHTYCLSIVYRVPVPVILHVKQRSTWVCVVPTPANRHCYKSDIQILLCSLKDHARQREAFREKATYPCHINSSFWRTTHDRRSKKKRFLYEFHSCFISNGTGNVQQNNAT